MRSLTKDPMASSKARKAERKADANAGLISIKLGGDSKPSSSGSSGFKKGGFKSAFGAVDVGEPKKEETAPVKKGGFKKIGGEVDTKAGSGSQEESDTEDEGYERYDPRFPTD